SVVGLFLGTVLCSVVGIWSGVELRQHGLLQLPATAGKNAVLDPPSPKITSVKDRLPLIREPVPPSSPETIDYGLYEAATSVSTLADQADDLIAEASYLDAVRILRRVCLEPGTQELSDSVTPQLLLRLAVCRERLGRKEEAIRDYQQLMTMSDDPRLRQAAILGQSRIRLANGEAQIAIEHLCRAFLTSGQLHGRMSTGRLAHLLAFAMASPQFPQNQPVPGRLTAQDVLERPFVPSLPVVPERILKEVEEPLDLPSSFLPPANEGIEQIINIGMDLSGSFWKVNTPETPVWTMLSEVAQQRGLSITASEEHQDRLRRKILEAHVVRLPLPVLLDLFLTPVGLTWCVEGEALQVLPMVDGGSLNDPATGARTMRMCELALSLAPQHDAASWTMMAQAALLLQSEDPKEIETAMRMFVTVGTQSHDPFFRASASLNQALCQRRLARMANEPDDDWTALYRAADLGTGGHPEIVANSLLGIRFLEAEEPARAEPFLRKAAQLADGHASGSEFRTLWASALYLQNEPLLANQILMDDAQSPLPKPLAAERAFLASLIRYHQTDSPSQKKREAVALLSSLQGVTLDETAGSHWYRLAVEAYLELGFFEEAKRLIGEARNLGVSPRMVLSMESAVDRETGMRARPILAPNSDDEQSLRSLLENPDVSFSERQHAFEALSALYQRRGDHDATVRLLLERSGEPLLPE
ncbi:MAG: hypothetical protein KDA80_09285, partial [Planctomycetaceae bacterium]|nr:hypothetical protein [Planctomycetaceae bacterium]